MPQTLWCVARIRVRTADRKIKNSEEYDVNRCPLLSQAQGRGYFSVFTKSQHTCSVGPICHAVP